MRYSNRLVFRGTDRGGGRDKSIDWHGGVTKKGSLLHKASPSAALKSISVRIEKSGLLGEFKFMGILHRHQPRWLIANSHKLEMAYASID